MKSDTASAFSIDGSMLPTASTVEDAPIEADSIEAGVKIDMAKAYLDLDDSEAAQELLQEAIVEGQYCTTGGGRKLIEKIVSTWLTLSMGVDDNGCHAPYSMRLGNIDHNVV